MTGNNANKSGSPDVKPTERRFGEVRRILVRSTNWVGDALMNTPFIAALAALFPDAEVDVLATPWTVDVFKGNPGVNKILVYRRAHGIKRFGPLFSTVSEVRKGRYDMAIHLQNAFEAALISFLARIPCRVGFPTDGRSFLLTHAIPTPRKGDRHEVEYYLDLLRGLTPETSIKATPLLFPLSEADRKKASGLLREKGTGERETHNTQNGRRAPAQELGFITVAPGASFGSAKCWPPERFAETAGRLNRKTGCPIIIVGGAGDRETCERIQRRLQENEKVDNPVNLAGETSLKDVGAIFERSALALANDSGLMHIAAALDRPLVAIFGPTNPKATGPFMTTRSRVIQARSDCINCGKRVCPTDHRCMTSITVDMAYDAALEVMSDRML